MKYKPKKKMVETALDNLVMGIVLEPSIPRLDHFKFTLDKLQEMGYNITSYTAIYEEIRDDYELKREKWKDAT